MGGEQEAGVEPSGFVRRAPFPLLSTLPFCQKDADVCMSASPRRLGPPREHSAEKRSVFVFDEKRFGDRKDKPYAVLEFKYRSRSELRARRARSALRSSQSTPS